MLNILLHGFIFHGLIRKTEHMKKEYLPRSYSLSWNAQECSLIIGIEKDMIKTLQQILNNPSLGRKNLLDLYQFSKFGLFGKEGKPYGFENQFLYKGENNFEIIYEWKIPPVSIFTDEVCPQCNGSEDSRFDSMSPCYPCRGTGKALESTNDKHFLAGMVTFHQLTNVINMLFCNKKFTKNSRKQVMTIEISHTSGMHRCYMSGWVDDSVLSYMETISESDENKIITAMKQSEDTVLVKDSDRNDFELLVRSGGKFHLRAPGNACTFGTEGGINFYDFGHAVCPHNIDNRFQQLAFIAGMATIHDLVEV